MDVESKANGRVCIPAKILLDSLKNIADQPLTFNIDKNFAVEITSDNGKYKVMGENPDNFPKEPSADDTNSFDMTSGALLTAINKTLFAVSNDDLRPAMTGVFFELSTTGVQFVATDAHRLLPYKRRDAKASKTDSFTSKLSQAFDAKIIGCNGTVVNKTKELKSPNIINILFTNFN
jgi:DNA polymerase-3 subunit beta